MDSSGPPDNGPVDEAIDLKAQDIYSQAQECKSLFTSYLDASRAPRAYHKQLRESERRFLTWASFLGVFANEGASLDSRLQYTPEIKELVLSMLQVLRRNLEHSIIRHAFSPTTSVATGPAENDGAMYGITGAIDRLHRLAMAIRQSPRTDEVERVRNFASKQPPNGFYNIILVMIQYLFPDAEKTLRVQLAESIIYRRHRLLWNRRHSKKLGRQRREKEKDQPSKKKQDEPVTQPKFSQSLRASPQQRSSSRVKAKSILSSTQFTRRPLGQVMNRNLLRVQDVSQQEDTRTGRSSNPPPTAQYPDRPPVTAGETKVMCQYCLTEIEIPLAASNKMKETLWRNHLDTDLRPYVCVSEECGGFPISFSNIKEWKAHMHNNHRADWTQYIHRVMWRCPYCSSDAEPFLTKDLLVRHLTENQAEDHAAAVDKLELARIIAKSKFALPRSANQCPLCGSPPWNDPGRMSKEPSTSSGLSGDVQEHFVTHLHHLALLSLSWWDNDIGLAVDTLDSGADSADVIGFNSDKSCNQKKENDTGGLYSWLDLDSAAMARISEIRAKLELQGQINQDTLIQSLEPFQEQLRLGFSNTWRQLEELRAGLRRENQTQQDELIIQLEQLYEQLRLGAEGIVPQENRSQLVIGQTIEPPYSSDQLAVSKGWHGVRYWKLAVILQDAHQKRELKQKSQSQKSSGFDPENSDASLSSVRSLADAIRDNTMESCFDGRSVAFLPEGRIHELISPEAIAEELPTLDSESLDDLDLLDFILGDAKKIFGICVFLEIEGPDLHRIMQHFHRSRFNDRTLLAPATISGPPEEIPAPFNERLWSISMRRSFFETQWIFLAPIFLSTGLMGHYHLNPDCILPVTWQSSTSTRRWFGQVFEAKVHPNHLESILPVIGGRLTQVPNDHPRVAIQYLHKTSLSVEVESILEHLHTEVYTRLSHKHIVRILATFALGGEYYILLEWGDKGNLRNLWAESPKTPELNPSLVKETLVQLRGLAAALYQLHEANYRHGHLKPENILRFQESNTGMCRWKIADMGVAAFTHMLDTTSGHRTGMDGEEGRYGSPEAVSDPDGARSRTGDIWSMGCIIIEHMIWLLYGNNELSRFNHEISRFFYHGELGAEPIVHPWVMAWIDHISNDQECAQATAMRDLLDIVRIRLLVVSMPPKSDDSPASISRATAEIFRNSMDEILSKAIDERYLYTGKTRENIQGPGEDVTEPQTVADFKRNLDNMIKRGGLGKFFPPGDPYVMQVANKAFELRTDPNNLLNSPAQIDGLAKLALYQPVLYCDDSWSMWVEENQKGKGDRWRAQVQLVSRISDIATRAVPNNNGCHLRFINTNTPTYNNLNKDQISNVLTNFPTCKGWTAIGTMLKKHVLDPFIYKDLNAGTLLKRPHLILVTTDGYPSKEKAMEGNPIGQKDENLNEDPDRFRKEIRKCGQELEKRNYRKDVVRFSISQFGKKISYQDDEEKIKMFLDGLESDPDIRDVFYRIADVMDARYEALRENEKNLQVWLLTTLLFPLQPLIWDNDLTDDLINL